MPGRIALTAVLAVCGLLGTSAAVSAQGVKVRGSERILAGWAMVDGGTRVRGARVRVTTVGGRNLLRKGARTSQHGTFSVRLGRAVPRRFVVTVAGGRGVKGRLRAVARRPPRGLELVHVNPVSTIVAAHFARAPRRGLAAAERNVRRLLRIPRLHDLAADLRRSSTHFDGRRFLERARRHRGVNRYVAALARAAAKRQKRVTFRSRPRAGAAAAEGGIGKEIMTALLDGLIEGPEDYGIDWVLDGIGFGGNEAGQLDEISAQMNELLDMTRQIEKEVAQLELAVYKLAAQLTRGEYSTLVAGFPATDVGSGDDQILIDMTWLVEHAHATCDRSDLAGCVGSLPANKDPRGWCDSAARKKSAFTKVACDALLRIAARDLDNTLPRAIDQVTGTAGADGILAVFQQSQFASLVAANGFVTADYADAAGKVYEHFAAIEALLAYYLTQYWNAEGLPADLIETRLEAFQAAIDEQADLLPAPLPGGVTIQAANGRMWGLARVPEGASGAGECFPAGSAHLWTWHLQSPSAACQAAFAAALGGTGGVGGWTLPSLSDLRGLPGTGSGVPNDTLTSLMRLPDTSLEAKAFRVPGPNPSALGGDVPTDGDYYGNPGTAFGLATADCTDQTVWNSGLTAVGSGYSSPVFAQGRGCRYVDLADGRVRTQCVWGDPGYYGCDLPASTTRENRRGRGAPIDYGHPLVVLLWRTPAAGEGWYKE